MMALAESDSGYGPAFVIVLALLIAGYFLPSIIAAARKVRNTGSIVVINLFLGWTFIGWVVALAIAARSVDAPPAPQQYPGVLYPNVSPQPEIPSESTDSESPSLGDIWR